MQDKITKALMYKPYGGSIDRETIFISKLDEHLEFSKIVETKQGDELHFFMSIEESEFEEFVKIIKEGLF